MYSVNVFNWSSVAACPLTATGFEGFHVVLVKPFIVPGSPLIVTFPAFTSPVVESNVICFETSVPSTTFSANLIS